MNLKEICLTLCGEIHKLLPYDRCSINLPHGKDSFAVYAEESRLPAPAIPEGISVAEGTATGWVMSQRAPVICRDVLADDRFPLTHERYRRVGIRSYIILPLSADRELLGALNLGSLSPDRFSRKDLDVLNPIADILSLAIQNSRLYEKSREREEMQKILKELNQDIAVLDVDTLLQKLTLKIREVLKVDVSDVRLMDDGEWRSVGVSGTEPGSLQPASSRVGRGLSRSVIQTGQTIIVSDMLAENIQDRPAMTRHGFRGYVGVPLFSRNGEVIGVLRVLTYHDRHFTQDEVELLQQLAGGAAIALENARLFKEVRQKSRDLEAMNRRLDRLLTEQSAMREVFSGINLLDLDELLKQLTGHALTLLRADLVRVLLSDGNCVRTVSSLGQGAELELGHTWPLGQGRTSWVMKTGKPLAIEDFTQETRFGATAIQRPVGMKGYLGIPLTSRQQKTIGLLVATTVEKRRFTAEEIAVAQQFAAGAAIAIENAYLLDETMQKSRHLEALIKVNRDIASLLNRTFLLPHVAECARQFLDVDGASFRLVEGDSLIRAGHAGDEDLLALSPTLRVGESISGRVVAENRVIAVRRVSDDPLIVEKHRRVLAEACYHSFLGVPLRLGESVIGTINLYSKREREFLPDEIELMTAFADQAAIAVENSRLFEELRKKSAELEDAFKVKTDFLNTMAHELRTPLNVVIGTQQLLADGSYGNLDAQQLKPLARIGQYSKELLDLINEILDLMRLDAKKVPLHAEEFSVREITDDLEVSFDPLAGEKGVKLEFHLADGIPPLRTDASRLREVLQNLVANAVKYTDRGTVKVRVSAQHSEHDRRIVWAISDTGIGIGQRDLPHIFEPFYMAEGVDRRKYPGSGLGLSIVKRIVELLQGDIRVDSEPGKGSTFTVTLPLHLKEHAERV